MLTFGIMLIGLLLFMVSIYLITNRLDRQYKTVGTPAPVSTKTVEEILKEVLKDPPMGCMWEVKKKIKHNRKLPSGKMIFDGSIDVVFAEITLITPYEKRSFSLPVDNLVDFEKSVMFNSQSFLKDYKKQLEHIESTHKQINDDWDGVYR